jgi:hypothetical protein
VRASLGQECRSKLGNNVPGVVEIGGEDQIIVDMFDRSNPITFEALPRLRRRLIGLRRKDVLRELENRGSALEASQKRAQAADSESQRLHKEIAGLREEVERANQELSELKEGTITDVHSGPGHSKFCDCPPSDTLLEEMTNIVSMTEESTQKILEHARITLMRDIDAAEALREQGRVEIAQAIAWRSHWGPVMKAFQNTIRETQGAIDDVPERMRDALAPLTAAAAALDHELLQFTGLGDGTDGKTDGEASHELTIDLSEANGADLPAEAADDEAIPVS